MTGPGPIAVELDADEVTGAPDGGSPVAVAVFVIVWITFFWHSYSVVAPAATLFATNPPQSVCASVSAP